MLPKLHRILMFLLPFANDIANALTISHTLDGTPFNRLYRPCSQSLNQKIKAGVIDSIALTGICWNVAYMGSKHGTKMGLIYGLIILTLSFIIPNLFMEPLINSLPYSQNNKVKLFGSFIFISVLFLTEITVANRLKNMKWKLKIYS